MPFNQPPHFCENKAIVIKILTRQLVEVLDEELNKIDSTKINDRVIALFEKINNVVTESILKLEQPPTPDLQTTYLKTLRGEVHLLFNGIQYIDFVTGQDMTVQRIKALTDEFVTSTNAST